MAWATLLVRGVALELDARIASSLRSSNSDGCDEERPTGHWPRPQRDPPG